MRAIAIYAVLLIVLLLTPQTGQQQSEPQPSQANGQPSKQQAKAQPANTPANQSPAKVNDDSEAARRREQQEREAKEAAFKAEQLRQNRIIVWATVAIAFFGFLSFVAAFIYAIAKERVSDSVKLLFGANDVIEAKPTRTVELARR